MRTTLSLFCLVLILACTPPAHAQLRADADQPAPVAVYDAEALPSPDASSSEGLTERAGNWLSTAFSDEHFRMSHSYELSMSSFGGGTSLGMYTNSMQWQFNDAWAARVDMSVAHQPLSGGAFQEDGQNLRVFLRNAEVAYRPSENMTFHFQVRQSPHGRYASPYGRRAPGALGPGAFGRSAFSSIPRARGGLFWKDQQRN